MDLHHLSQIVEKLWNGWELRILMLLSLFLQTILAIFGDRRKYATGFWLRFVVWLAYMSADWVATFSLGILARSQTNSANPNLIPVFWAPILLLHLGGPETITAYTLADNELWTRRLLELVIQAGVASYVLYKLWSRNTIIFVAIPIFVSGIIKYGERIWAFSLATSESFSAQANHPSVKVPCITMEDLSSNSLITEVRSFNEARLLYRTVQILSANLLLENLDHKITYDMVSVKNSEEAFQLTEIELGFMYNRLYSKVTEISSLRIILHSITFLSSISALISFSIMTMSKNVYSKYDTMISYSLLVGAVLLDCYSITVFFTSDWGVLWLGGFEMPFHIFGRICFPLQAFCMKSKRWSTSMGQHNLISAQSNKPVNKILKKYFPGKWNVDSREKVEKELKELIFNQVLDKRSRYDPSTDDFNALENLLEERGLEVLRRKHICFDRFGWSVAGSVEFIHSLLTWHIATHVCFFDDSRKNTFDKNRNCVMSSRSLSNYMLYLLVDCPAMLAVQLSGTRYADTTIHLRRLLLRNTREEVEGNNPLDASSFQEAEVKAFLKELVECPSAMLNKIDEVKMSALLDGCMLSMSALLDGCMLGVSLQSLETQDGWPNEKKWEMISEVWVDMLMYAASRSVWKEHADALSQGGELLTHVCLLMAHLGLSKQCPPEVSEQLDARYRRLGDIVGHEA